MRRAFVLRRAAQLLQQRGSKRIASRAMPGTSRKELAKRSHTQSVRVEDQEIKRERGDYTALVFAASRQTAEKSACTEFAAQLNRSARQTRVPDGSCP